MAALPKRRRTGAGIPALAGEIEARIRPEAPVAAVRALSREYSLRLRDAPPAFVIGLALRLSRVRITRHRFIAYELVRHHPAALARLGARQLERLGLGIASWDAVDCFAVCLAGHAWRGRRVPDALIHRWARSGDRWWRRAALVSTVPLNSRAQGGSGDRRRTLRVCGLLERDRDPVVAKALSWALRELAKRDPGAVRVFLGARAGVLPALVLREVRNKLETGLKNPRRG
jgi:3-methyladenine DNA glycosylase AlkD